MTAHTLGKALLQNLTASSKLLHVLGELLMSEFKYRQFRGEIILWAVRWYCKYGISYRDLEEMLKERGVDVDHTTLYRWVQ